MSVYLSRGTSRLSFLLLLVIFSICHAAWSLPYNAGRKNSSRNSSDPLTENVSTNLRQRRSSHHNDWDQRLYRVCNTGYGMYHVESEHHNYYEDRRWRWECRQVFQTDRNQTCSWTPYENEFDQQIIFMCGRDEYLRGVESYHSNYHEDRRWRFYCCHSPGYITKSCEITGYTNSWDGPMNFQARSGGVITGVFSYHDNYRE